MRKKSAGVFGAILALVLITFSCLNLAQRLVAPVHAQTSDPTVTTGGSENITATTAQVQYFVGNIHATTTEVTRYGTNDTSCGSLPNTLPAAGPFTPPADNSNGWLNITDLTPSTRYYYCATATTADTTVYGIVKNFTTHSASADLPTITTTAATQILSTSARLNSSFTLSAGGSIQKTMRINYKYGTTAAECNSLPNTTITGDITTTAPGIHSFPLTGLTANTTYYYCAVLREVLNLGNGSLSDPVYGGVLHFTTSPNPALTCAPGSAECANPPEGCHYAGDASYCTCGELVCDTTPNPSITGSADCPLKSQGDANCDGAIKMDDFTIWRDAFLTNPLPGTISTLPVNLQPDFNADGVINTDDFNIWRDGFLNTSLPH